MFGSLAQLSRQASREKFRIGGIGTRVLITGKLGDDAIAIREAGTDIGICSEARLHLDRLPVYHF